MKQFTDIRSAANYIFSHANTGNEKTINEVLYFGMGVYAFADECDKVGVKGDVHNGNGAFYHLTRKGVITLLAWLLKTDGYLCVM